MDISIVDQYTGQYSYYTPYSIKGAENYFLFRTPRCQQMDNNFGTEENNDAYFFEILPLALHA